jgi:ADP-ribose pyrophosphatase YjhB (NUDIX family)
MSSEQLPAFFGPPIKRYVTRGTHLALEAILRRAGAFLALRRPQGLFGGPKDKLYFPHGEFRWGEAVAACTRRLLHQETGTRLVAHQVVDLWSWLVKERAHWHLVVVVVADIKGEPRLSRSVSEIVHFSASRIPDDFGWWTVRDLHRTLKRAGASVPA